MGDNIEKSLLHFL